MKNTHFCKAFITFASLFLVFSCKNDGANSKPAIAADKAIEAAVERTLDRMDLREKAGQLVQITLDVLTEYGQDVKPEQLDRVIGEYKVGSILNVCKAAPTRAKMEEIVRAIQDKSMEAIGIPDVYGLDMIHGATYYKEGTFFPQEINLAATFDPAHAAAMGKAIGYETRAGLVPWVFSPVMDLGRTALWPRHWESFGEDPYVQSVMAAAETRAIQGSDPNHIGLDHCAVSLKHYLAYGNPASGKDRTPAYVTEQDLREKYFAPFKACIEAGALTVMVNSAAINGIPTHANTKLLTGWLKEGLNWDGMIVTDWADINNLYERDHVATDRKDAVRIGINAGIDMIMDPYDPAVADDIVALVEEGKISRKRLDDAVRRVLRVKYRLGLFDDPVWDTSSYELGSAETVRSALDAAIESEVLLKNTGGLLPLSKGTRILLTGPNANSMRCLNGGWSYSWQGSGTEQYTEQFNTIYEALKARFADVRLVEGVSYDDSGSDWQADKAVDIQGAVAAARGVDVIVACIGENSYCETPGNIDDLSLSANQTALVKALATTGKPIVLILSEGRPRIVREIEPLAAAVVDIMLPGNYGGDALAELLCGDVNFSGKLPFTYPKYVNSLHTYDYKVSEHRETMEGMYNYDATMDVQWPFGAGLGYTSFEYSDFKVKNTRFKAGDVISVSLKVKNTGKVAGKEAVILYSSDLVASVIPDVRRVRAFKKVELAPGKETTVEFSLPANDLAFVGADGRWTLEKGEFRLSSGGLSEIVSCTKTKVWKTQNIN